MRYVFSKSERNIYGTITIPKSDVNRWERQMNTNYDDLLDEKKESDRKEADDIIEIINEM